MLGSNPACWLRTQMLFQLYLAPSRFEPKSSRYDTMLCHLRHHLTTYITALPPMLPLYHACHPFITRITTLPHASRITTLLPISPPYHMHHHFTTRITTLPHTSPLYHVRHHVTKCVTAGAFFENVQKIDWCLSFFLLQGHFPWKKRK